MVQRKRDWIAVYYVFRPLETYFDHKEKNLFAWRMQISPVRILSD